MAVWLTHRGTSPGRWGVNCPGSVAPVEQRDSAGMAFTGDNLIFPSTEEIIGYMSLYFSAAVLGILLIAGLIYLSVFCTCKAIVGPTPSQPLCGCCRKTQQDVQTELPATYFSFPSNPIEENQSYPSAHWVSHPGPAASEQSSRGPARCFTGTI